MEEEERCAGPAGSGGMLLADSGCCACFLVSRLEVALDGGAHGVEVEDARGVHDEGRPAEKLVRAMPVDPALHVQLYKQDGINE